MNVRGRRDSMPEGEFGGPAAALLDGLEEEDESGSRGGLPRRGAMVIVLIAAVAGELAAERREVLPSLTIVPDGLHVRVAVAEHSKRLRRRARLLGERS